MVFVEIFSFFEGCHSTTRIYPLPCVCCQYSFISWTTQYLLTVINCYNCYNYYGTVINCYRTVINCFYFRVNIKYFCSHLFLCIYIQWVTNINIKYNFFLLFFCIYASFFMVRGYTGCVFWRGQIGENACLVLFS